MSATLVDQTSEIASHMHVCMFVMYNNKHDLENLT